MDIARPKIVIASTSSRLILTTLHFVSEAGSSIAWTIPNLLYRCLQWLFQNWRCGYYVHDYSSLNWSRLPCSDWNDSWRLGNLHTIEQVVYCPHDERSCFRYEMWSCQYETRRSWCYDDLGPYDVHPLRYTWALFASFAIDLWNWIAHMDFQVVWC